MRTKHLVVGFLVVAAMTGGYIAQSRINDPSAQVIRNHNFELSYQKSAYASNDSSSDVGVRSDVDLGPLRTFYSSLKLLREEYVEPIQKSQERDLTYESLKNMLDSLHDPLTRFLEPDQAKLVEDARVGKFHGIGAVIGVVQKKQEGVLEEQLVITTTLPGSPARSAGLMTGDVITSLDGKTILPYDPFQRVELIIKNYRNSTIDREQLPKLLEAESDRIKNGISFQKAMDMLSTSGAKDYTLTISRQGSKTPVIVKVEPTLTAIDPVTFSTPAASVGYIHINLMNKAAETKVAEAISGFKKSGVKSVVIDLRDSVGGSIESAQAIAGAFIPNKTISIVQSAHNKRQVLKASSAKLGGWPGPVAVIVNGGTTGVSEVLAAALHEDAASKLIGSHTSGNNIQQTFVPLKDGSAFTMTTGKYLTPNGTDYRGKGLAVTIAVPSSAEKSNDDVQLTAAVKSLTSVKGRG